MDGSFHLKCARKFKFEFSQFQFCSNSAWRLLTVFYLDFQDSYFLKSQQFSIIKLLLFLLNIHLLNYSNISSINFMNLSHPMKIDQPPPSIDIQMNIFPFRRTHHLREIVVVASLTTDRSMIQYWPSQESTRQPADPI